MESVEAALKELIKQAQARYDAMTPEQRAKHDRCQRESYVRSITKWPKPKFHWVNGVKVYDSYEDYCND